MELESLYIEKEKYGANAGRFMGTVKFANDAGKIELHITSDQANKIIALCAEGMIAAAVETAKMITANILDQVKSLPAPEEPTDNVIF